MSTQSEALRLADTLERMSLSTRWDKEAAAELRRLHQSEREGWRHADELEQERKRLHEVNQELLEALKYCRQKMTYMMNHGEWYTPGKAIDLADAAIAKAQEQK